MSEIRPPYNQDQIKSFNEFQHSSRWHPFTCGNNSSHKVLVCTNDGIYCSDCGYEQFWMHEFMSNWDWKRVIQND